MAETNRKMIENQVKESMLAKIIDFLTEQGEDCERSMAGASAGTCCNMPYVLDGVEGWLEIHVKTPKEYGDEGYEKRESYKVNRQEAAAKAAEKEAAKKKKIEQDEKCRAEKAASKAGKS